MEINSEETIRKIFDECRAIAVVGLSSNPFRPSNGVAAYMQKKGFRVIPVNSNETEVLGEKSFANLSEVSEKIDLADVFRRSEEARAVVDMDKCWLKEYARLG